VKHFLKSRQSCVELEKNLRKSYVLRKALTLSLFFVLFQRTDADEIKENPKSGYRETPVYIDHSLQLNEDIDPVSIELYWSLAASYNTWTHKDNHPKIKRGAATPKNPTIILLRCR